MLDVPIVTLDTDLLEVWVVLYNFCRCAVNEPVSPTRACVSLPSTPLDGLLITRSSFPSSFLYEPRTSAFSRESPSVTHAFDVRAAPNELHCLVADPQFMNTGESSGFLFESSRNGADVAGAKNSKVLRLGNRTRQSTNFVIRSFGASLKRKSTERVLQSGTS
jgi:hypothetical protein